ncbi:dihydropteroate synthase [Novispirillum sp. DQ9]|uniref:dihydropteroate synthase n=1 Tax=Novispirillum sp. DQ9 TaxID=3398612 RepID=UPI003C79A951
MARDVHLAPLGVAARGAPVPGWEVLLRTGPDAVTSVDCGRADVLAWARDCGETVHAHVRRRMATVEAPRPAFAGLSMDRPRVMGILNATPDSFSDGGRHFAVDDAVRGGLAMLEAGADILDVGGESTRPGSEEVLPEEEIRRVVPVIRALAERGALVSIDTRHAAVMEAAVAAGAAIINDVTALTGEPASLPTAARLGVPVILMHIQGEPRTMQADPRYSFAPLDVFDWLEARVEACLAAGIARADLCVDPGIGFGKTVEHNAQILKRLGLLHGLGCPVLLGISRKIFIARVSRGEPPLERLPGSLAAAVMGAERGMHILRVHDVAETVQALAVVRAVEMVS